ncbi:hypothetical protein ACFOSC_02265 [Streptantibioticus rubrisoli]|uniref:Uncharacterized protein n=1 Tax=Streptantibioticus rubrisoli TaxID=1387313 RepID=A0ABT1PDF8_9ACTN|nr:hypothetical protein [Streptantibioticus rubrisoli]MCQ4043405.1 hypothetical protein [Streptantibioticus rubrisoli]
MRLWSVTFPFNNEVGVSGSQTIIVEAGTVEEAKLVALGKAASHECCSHRKWRKIDAVHPAIACLDEAPCDHRGPSSFTDGCSCDDADYAS